MVGRRRSILLGVVAVAGAGSGLWWLGSEGSPHAAHFDRRDGGREASRPALAGPPLFEHRDLYRDGRSAWLAGRLAAARDALGEVDSPPLDAPPRVEVTVHDGPFTEGPWVEQLDEAARRRREAAETRCVESRVLFCVRGVSPPKVLLYLAFSGFVEELGEPGEYTTDRFLEPLSDLSEIEGLRTRPEFDGASFLVRTRWLGGSLAKPTAVIYSNRLLPDACPRALVYELWENCGDEEAVRILFAGGQFAVRPVPGGSLVGLRAFYKGQEFPALLSSMVVSETEAWYARYVETIRAGAPGWTPEPATLAWLDEQAPDLAEVLADAAGGAPAGPAGLGG